MLKDFLKDIWHDDKSNLAEKVGMTLVSPFVVGVSKMLNGPQGGKIIEHVNKFPLFTQICNNR